MGRASPLGNNDMAEKLSFHYSSGSSFLHRVDLRIKIAGILLLSIILIKPGPWKLLGLGGLLLAMSLPGRKSRAPFRLSPAMWIMPALILLGNFFSLYSLPEGTFSFAAQVACIRLASFLLVLYMGHLFISTSDPLELPSALYSILRHIPFLRAGRICSILGLTLSLLPLILDESREIREAMISRGGWSARRPLKNMAAMGLPLLNGILVKASALADAMESRLYDEDNPPPG